MEERLDSTILERSKLQQDWQHAEDQDDEERIEVTYEAVVENAGKIRGMLEMVAIMRSTSAKVELQRARARIKYGPK